MKIELEFIGREEKIITDAANTLEMSPKAVIKHWMRMGQFCDVLIGQGEKIRFMREDGTVYDPFAATKKASEALPQG